VAGGGWYWDRRSLTKTQVTKSNTSILFVQRLGCERLRLLCSSAVIDGRASAKFVTGEALEIIGGLPTGSTPENPGGTAYAEVPEEEAR
jgi:hypothetical protein